MKLAVIADNGLVQRFALDALDAVECVDEITVFSCTNTRLPKRWVRHGAYYALNMLAVRNRLTRYVPIASGKKRIAQIIEFDSDREGAWQALPERILEALNAGGFDLVLKFGMGLLRVPPRDALSVPILSFHHGDPDRYRGRPAGFWEMADGAEVVGQVVQVIGNRLDAGEIVAYAETKVYPWSYRATLLEAYRHSPLIINRAIRNALGRKSLDKPCTGRNCRLPGNATAARFVGIMAWRFIRRLAYGALKEKAWRVSTAPLTGESALPVDAGALPSPREWRTLDVASGYAFYADPFFTGSGGAILVEALNARTGLGEIVVADAEGSRLALKERGHLSYPSTARIDGREFIIPETARWSPPRVYAVEGENMRLKGELRIEGNPRVLDPTVIEYNGTVFLFGNIREIGSNALFLWSSDSLENPFTPHPESPIRISPRGSRMGGALVRSGARLLRLGQDFTRGYGDGLIAFEVEALTSNEYREREIGSLRFEDRRGPHTLNVRPGEIVFDWYQDRLSPFAGIRRIAGRLRS